MSEIPILLFAFPKHTHDMRMLLDRVLEPDAAHPLIRDLLESLRSSRFGEAQFSLQEIKQQLGVTHASLQADLSHLMFANALHSPAPFKGFQYLIDANFDPTACATRLMEHMALGQYFNDRELALSLFHWLIQHGGLIEPESRSAWKALEAIYPEIFAINHSRHETKKLDAYIRSQSLEVREVTRL